MLNKQGLDFMITLRIGKTAAASYSLLVGIFFLTILLGGCAGKKHVSLAEPVLSPFITIYPKKVKRKPGNSYIIGKILRDAFDDWKGTPHRMGGCSKKGIDCSCFVRKIYEDYFYYDVNNLPRTVKGLSNMERGKPISKNDLQPGDLVIFHQQPPWYPYHVGIFLGDNEFVHASKSQGVIISRIDDPYHWAKSYSKSIRLLTEKDKQKIVERRGFVVNSKRQMRLLTMRKS